MGPKKDLSKVKFMEINIKKAEGRRTVARKICDWSVIIMMYDNIKKKDTKV